jgi:hypothetical protein
VRRGTRELDDRRFYLGFPRWLPAVADDGSTKGVATTIAIVNRRGRSRSAPYQADLAIENPTH